MRGSGEICYGTVMPPKPDCTGVPVLISDAVMEKRCKAVLERMEQENLDSLVVYGDLEHGQNFAYLTGFLPRFEEALLVLNKDGHHAMMMGNENLNKVSCARIKAQAIHVPFFSLPNQPMCGERSLTECFWEAGLKEESRIGIAGWKYFTSRILDNRQLFDVPSYIVDAVRDAAGPDGTVVNAADIFIGKKGVRCINTANELAHYEFGAALASDCILKAMDHLDIGVKETELGADLQALGQKNSVVTIAAAGKRFEKANLYPMNKDVKLGDPVSLTVGYRGGLSSRCGYAVHSENELPEANQNYLDRVVKPYYHAIVSWLGEIHCGISGGELYDRIEQILPKEEYRWSLCPGHLTADEEWMSSPVYEASEEILKSGMMLQTDIIPSVPGYAGTSVESTIALADETLRMEIQKEEPQLWERIVKRRSYLEKVLGIRMHPDVLPMCSTVAYLRPFLLEKGKAMYVKHRQADSDN